MIKIVTTEELKLTKVEYSDFGGVLETELPIGTEVTLWLTAPKDIGGGVGLKWDISLMMWEGDYTMKNSSPSLVLKELSKKYRVSLFNSDGTNKYPFNTSDRDYIFSMIDDQNRLLVQFFYDNGIFPENSLEIVGI